MSPGEARGSIASIVLAAGASTRMGRPKMLLPVTGGTVLAVSVSAHLLAGVERVVVVLGHLSEEIRRDGGLPADPRLRLVVNESWESGIASSLRRGLEECPGMDAVLVALGDQPGVTAERVRRIVTAWTPGTSLVVPVHGGRAGHPVLFGSSLWPELLALSGDVGGREVVKRRFREARLVEAGPAADLDTEEDYRAFLEGRPGRPDEGWPVPLSEEN